MADRVATAAARRRDARASPLFSLTIYSRSGSPHDNTSSVSHPIIKAGPLVNYSLTKVLIDVTNLLSVTYYCYLGHIAFIIWLIIPII